MIAIEEKIEIIQDINQNIDQELGAEVYDCN